MMEIFFAQNFDDSEIKHIDHPDWFMNRPAKKIGSISNLQVQRLLKAFKESNNDFRDQPYFKKTPKTIDIYKLFCVVVNKH